MGLCIGAAHTASREGDRPAIQAKRHCVESRFAGAADNLVAELDGGGIFIARGGLAEAQALFSFGEAL